MLNKMQWTDSQRSSQGSWVQTWEIQSCSYSRLRHIRIILFRCYIICTHDNHCLPLLRVILEKTQVTSQLKLMANNNKWRGSMREGRKWNKIWWYYIIDNFHFPELDEETKIKSVSCGATWTPIHHLLETPSKQLHILQFPRWQFTFDIRDYYTNKPPAPIIIDS